MPSGSHSKWTTTRADALDAMETAHKRLGAAGAGLVFMRQQVIQGRTMPMKKGSGSRGAAHSASVHIGDLVQITFGSQKMKGKVVEDRGRIGYKGRNLYRILVTTGANEPMDIELPADEFQITRRASASRKLFGASALRAKKPAATSQK